MKKFFKNNVREYWPFWLVVVFYVAMGLIWCFMDEKVSSWAVGTVWFIVAFVFVMNIFSIKDRDKWVKRSFQWQRGFERLIINTAKRRRSLPQDYIDDVLDINNDTLDDVLGKKEDNETKENESEVVQQV